MKEIIVNIKPIQGFGKTVTQFMIQTTQYNLYQDLQVHYVLITNQGEAILPGILQFQQDELSGWINTDDYIINLCLKKLNLELL